MSYQTLIAGYENHQIANQNKNVGNGDPALLTLFFARDVLACLSLSLPETENKIEEDEFAQKKPETNDPEDQVHQKINITRIGRGGRDKRFDHESTLL